MYTAQREHCELPPRPRHLYCARACGLICAACCPAPRDHAFTPQMRLHVLEEAREEARVHWEKANSAKEKEAAVVLLLAKAEWLNMEQARACRSVCAPHVPMVSSRLRRFSSVCTHICVVYLCATQGKGEMTGVLRLPHMPCAGA